MTGQYKVEVWSKKVKYELTITRNITIICGDSGTGKTTLVNMIRDSKRVPNVFVSCDKNCVVVDEGNWKEDLDRVTDSIVFIDEGGEFIVTEEFANKVKHSTNYFVIITRRNLDMLPYSVNEIYEIKESGKFRNEKQIYNKLSMLYSKNIHNELKVKPDLIISEDSNSVFEFFTEVARYFKLECISAKGKNNVPKMIDSIETNFDKNILLIVDGAAFGPVMNSTMKAIINSKNKYYLYTPESFEWLILKSGVIDDQGLSDKLTNTFNYAASDKYFSWERYFKSLLSDITQNTHLQYSKTSLNRAYKNISMIKRIVASINILDLI